ncbi:hypothetical protein [Megasphaera sp.]|uniref:hypothetical protein n=1 Tax=Megasphaera sp. TaxID=2023260 RepID=UPI003520C9C9
MNEDKEKEPCKGMTQNQQDVFWEKLRTENINQNYKKELVIFEGDPVKHSKFPIVIKDWIVYIRITKNTTWYLGIPPYFVIGSRWVSDNGCSIEDEWMDGIDAVVFGLGILLAVFGIALQILVWIYR